MKKILIVLGILVFFFIGGILIYDFSDEMDYKLTSHSWYTLNEGNINILSFNNNVFSYVDNNNESIKEYSECTTYKYNSSSNVVKLDCDIDNDKIYIATYNDNELVLTMDGVERKLFSSESLAFINSFKLENNLTDEEYNNLFNINIDEDKVINIDKLNNLISSNKTNYVAIIRSEYNYNNILNYYGLSKIINDNYYFINIDNLNVKDLNKLNKKTKLNEYDNNIIYIYKVGNKKIELKESIKINNIKEIESFAI